MKYTIKNKKTDSLSYGEFQGERGVVALSMTLIVLFIGVAMVVSLVFVFINRIEITRNLKLSEQAYFSAESGIEDALLRLQKGLNWSSPYSIAVGGGTSNITISPVTGGARTIIATGDISDRQRSVEVLYSITTTSAQFFYGAQVGDLGVIMENNSSIEGNVFSNGSIQGIVDETPSITGTVNVADVGNSINNISVGGDVYVDTCTDSDIAGDLYALTDENCTHSSFIEQSPPDPIDMPVSQEQIDDWKADALTGGVINGDQSYSSGTHTIGPAKIEGNFTVSGTAQITLNGTLWVTGDISLRQSAQVKLNPNFGSISGVVVSDGQITLSNSSVSSGSGSEGSYLMHLSTAISEQAVVIENFAEADILYTSAGRIEVANNTIIREVVGFGLRIRNSAEVKYEIGLENASFFSGPSGGWEVISWKEI